MRFPLLFEAVPLPVLPPMPVISHRDRGIGRAQAIDPFEIDTLAASAPSTIGAQSLGSCYATCQQFYTGNSAGIAQCRQRCNAVN